MNRLLLIAASGLALAACAKKAPVETPPPPPTSTEAAPTTGTETGAVGNTVVPGSRADFLQAAGSDTVRFATDSSEVDADARATLDAQAQWLAKYPNVRATIEGHCDERGTREYNLALGDRRATAAKNYLVARGVAEGRLSVISYGKERPAETGSDEGAWAANRRAVTVVPQ